MCGCRLRIAAIGLHLGSVDQVGELDRVLDEEHRDIVTDDFPNAFGRVEFHRNAADVARRIDRAVAARDRGKAREHGRLRALLEEPRLGDVADVVGGLENAVRRRAARMDDSLGNALMIEMEDLLAEDKILEQDRPAVARFQAVLIVRYAEAMIGGEIGLRIAVRAVLGDLLMRFAAVALRRLKIRSHVHLPKSMC